MKRRRVLSVVAAALAAACGDVTERADCDTSAACPTGQYCAHTQEGSVCWPDTVLPEVGGVTAGCEASPCPRDGSLVVTATASDDREVFAVEAEVDVAPGRAFALQRGEGGTWSGTIDLATVPFPALEGAVNVTVRVRDGARNVDEASAEVGVTRVRWVFGSSGQLTPPAVATDGTVVFGRSDTNDQLVAVHPDGTEAWRLKVGAGTVTSPPSIGEQAIWVGANDGKLYAVELDGSAERTARTCTASGTAKGPPAVLTTGGVDVAFGAFSNGRIYASKPSACAETPLRDPFTSGVAVAASDKVLAVTGSAGSASLRGFRWDGGAFEELWQSATGGTVSATPALDATGRIFTAAADAGVDATSAAGLSAAFATLDGSVDESPIVLSNGDIVVGDASGKLHRFDPTGARVWATPVDLGAPVHAPMAMKDGAVQWFLVATSDGKVHAVSNTGTILWEGALTAMALGAGNLHTPAAGQSSTAYFAGADGKLYAVIVEGALDTSAPWPKAWHDARNTSRASGAF